MRRAHERNAAIEGKFFFRNNIDYAAEDEGPAPLPGTGTRTDGKQGVNNGGSPIKEIYEYSPCDFDPQSGLEEMSLSQIMEGKASLYSDTAGVDVIVGLLCFFMHNSILKSKTEFRQGFF